MIQQSVDEFIDQEIEPLEDQHRDRLSPDYKRLDDQGFLREEVVDLIDTVRRKSGEAGFYGMHVPEKYGGGGFDLVSLAQVVIHIYRRGLGLNIHITENAPGPHPNLFYMDEALHDEYLKPLVEGKKSSCFAITESSSGSDTLNMKTRAEKDDDHWVISGTKMWITNAPYADFGQVFAITDPEREGSHQISAFLFDLDQPGVEVKRANQTLLNDGMQAEVQFNDCRIPDRKMIGDRGEGFEGALEFINQGRVRIGARCAGLMQYLLHQCVEYANERTSWGKPIGTRQHIRSLISDIAVWQQNAENLTLRTAWKVDQGEQPVKETAMVKYYCTEKLFEAADAAVQVFGANGLSQDYPIERIFRYARLMRIPEGTSEIQKETIASRLGL